MHMRLQNVQRMHGNVFHPLPSLKPYISFLFIPILQMPFSHVNVHLSFMLLYFVWFLSCVCCHINSQLLSTIPPPPPPHTHTFSHLFSSIHLFSFSLWLLSHYTAGGFVILAIDSYTLSERQTSWPWKWPYCNSQCIIGFKIRAQNLEKYSVAFPVWIFD